jgi:hypothetical protein
MRFHSHVGLLLVSTCFALTVARDFLPFQKWLQDHKGYKFGTVKAIENGEDYGMLVASQAIGENFLIAKLPTESVFSEETVNLTLSGFGCDDEKALDGLDARTRFITAFILERDNPDTQWAPMFKNLPKDPLVPPPFWKKEDLMMLQGSGLYVEVLKERGIYEREYGKLISAKKCPGFGEKYSMEDFLRGGSFIGRNGIGAESIVPFLDLANHDGNPNAEIGQVQDEGIIAMVSLRDIRAGEEITISYHAGVKEGSTKAPRSDLRMFTQRGFVQENPLPQAKIVLPQCTPPSVLSAGDAGEDDLPSCCQDDSSKDDAFCYGSHIRTPDVEKALHFGIQMPLGKKTKHSAVADLSEVLQRLRTVLAEAGFLPNCYTKELDLHRPLDMASEREVMRIFRALLSAHLTESAWATTGEAAQAGVTEAYKELAKSAHRVERPVLEWFVEFTEYADRFLQLSDADKLQIGLCEALLDKTDKAKQAKMAEFGWLVEHILAPLAFAPRLENGEACSVEEATYKMKAKECKELLADKKDEL